MVFKLSLKKNIFANYLGQGWTAPVGDCVAPHHQISRHGGIWATIGVLPYCRHDTHRIWADAGGSAGEMAHFTAGAPMDKSCLICCTTSKSSTSHHIYPKSEFEFWLLSDFDSAPNGYARKRLPAGAVVEQYQS